jgi:2-hydroxy-6-oxonona-2,4-dienedioate hydrolase
VGRSSALRTWWRARRRFAWERVRVGGAWLDVRRATPRPADIAPTVVLLPGLALSGHYVLPVGAALAGRFPVLVPDLPGHARRRRRRGALDLAELADAVAGWMDVVGLDQAVLVGNSAGCQVAIEVAARHPRRVAGVVLEGPTIDAEARSVWRHVGRVFLAGRREPPSLGPIQAIDWLSTGPRVVVATVRAVFRHRPEQRVAAVACPALVVRGEDDPIVPHAWAARLAAGLPDGELCVVPDTSHALVYTHPELLAGIVERFVEHRLA